MKINFNTIISNYSKVTGKSILCTKPVHLPEIKFKDLSPVKLDTLEITNKKIYEILPENKTLFSWAKQHPTFNFEKIDPESMVLVHRTSYFPKDGKILSSNLATKEATGIGEARSTIHFALNKSVSEHELGNEWNKMEYAIITPFKETISSTPKNRVLGGYQEDFFFQDVLKLPKGSVILKYNPEVKSKTLQISETFDGIKLIETSSNNLPETINTIIEKMGYSPYIKALKQTLNATDEEIMFITSPNINNFMNIVKKYGGTKKYREIIEKRIAEDKSYYSKENFEILYKNHLGTIKAIDNLEKFQPFIEQYNQSWAKFCTKNNLFNGEHANTAWFKGEMAINTIQNIVHLNNNSWGENYKKIILTVLDDAVKLLPKDKTLCFDVKKAKDIITKSKTPKVALEELEQKLHLKPVHLKDSNVYNNCSLSDEDKQTVLEILLQELHLTNWL